MAGMLLLVEARSQQPPSPAPGPGPALAARVINDLGLRLLKHSGSAKESASVDANAGAASAPNALLSPYSIQTALAMTYAGADGATREEMARVLAFKEAGDAIHPSFGSLRQALDGAVLNASRMTRPAGSGQPGTTVLEPFVLATANRLFGQKDYAFKLDFVEFTRTVYKAVLQPLDFVGDVPGSIKLINGWVEEQTRRRIQNLIPSDGLDVDTRLVLVNAIYFKAPWAVGFSESRTRPEPFLVLGKDAVIVPTMVRTGPMGYAENQGFEAVTLPYVAGDLQFLLLLPSKTNGLASMERDLTVSNLMSNATLRTREIALHMPRFRLEPPLMLLGQALRGLGMRSAFDKPRGTANFDRMAARKPNDYLSISEVFHKTFVAVDEHGTEAAAATAVSMMTRTSMPAKPTEALEVRVDRPFLFAIQHRSSGACLFLGRVSDPR